MIDRRTPSLFLVFAAIVTAGVAVYASVMEGKAFNGPVTTTESFGLIAANDVAIGLSMQSRHALLDTCLNAQTSVLGRLRPLEMQAAIRTTCRKVSATLVQEMPTFGYAWFILALSSATDQVTLASEALATSQHFAATEGWLAALRVDFAENTLATLSVEAEAAEDSDLALLLRSEEGPPLLARRYVVHPSFRERVIAIAEMLPASVQKRFVNEVSTATEALR